MADAVPEGVRILGMVGARGGSKGLPGKNIMDFAGKPLISWAMGCLEGSRYISRSILSTDDAKIREVCLANDHEAPFLRPPELALDDTPIEAVVQHVIEWAKGDAEEPFDYILLAHPTVPLRRSHHIDAAIEQYFRERRSDDETLVSVTPMPQKMGWLTQRNASGYLSFCFGENGKIPHRRQALGHYFMPNGAIYFAPLRGFTGEFYGPQTQVFEMPADVSVDIDTQEDFDRALTLYRTQGQGGLP